MIITSDSLEDIDTQVWSGEYKNSDNAEEIEVNNHVKVVSIAKNVPGLYALYEDGYVCNSAVLNSMDADWEDVIQITDGQGLTNVALKDDGSVIYGNITSSNLKSSEYVRKYNDYAWLKEVDDWSDIIKIDYKSDGDYIDEGMRTAVLLGLDSNGKVHYTTYESKNYGRVYRINDVELVDAIVYKSEMISFLEGLSDIQDIQMSESVIAAYDSKGVVHIFDFRDGTVSEKTNIKSIWSDDDNVYVLNVKNVLSKLDSTTKILEGIVYMWDGFCVSQNGAIYKCDGTSTGGKTLVKDVW